MVGGEGGKLMRGGNGQEGGVVEGEGDKGRGKVGGECGIWVRWGEVEGEGDERLQFRRQRRRVVA
jgi:hypothetical protein